MLTTTLLTGFWRWLVPNTEAPTSTRDCSCSGRTLEGPQPKRPSAGLRSAGMIGVEAIASSVPSLVFCTTVIGEFERGTTRG